MFSEQCFGVTPYAVVSFFRYLAQKKIPKALELVEKGTLQLLEAKQVRDTLPV